MRTADPSSILDPQGYLQRIHFSAAIDLTPSQPSSRLLGALHQAHLLAVPFENLSIHYGQPITLEDGRSMTRSCDADAAASATSSMAYLHGCYGSWASR